jgi:tetratricopeptide (TPR) repeat protein
MGAKAASKLGDLAVWKEDIERAVAEYAVAVSWDPRSVNFGQLLDSLGGANFIECMKGGCAAFEARYGDRDAAQSTPLWWLGYAQFQEKEFANCDETFGRVLELFPAYTNSWWYRAEARFHQSNTDGFLECLRKLSEYGMDVLAAQIQTNFAHNSFVLSGALKRLSDEKRLFDAAYICEVRVASNPKSWEYWDNLGLFCRDAGESLVGRIDFPNRKATKADHERANPLFERANVAYEQAFILDSTKPHLLNDRAVILDYYLNREHELAISLYERSHDQSTELLKDSEALGEFEQSLAEIAKRDSANNKARLLKRLERERKKREREEAKKKKGDEE